MPDTKSHPAASRKLGGIPQGEETSPSIYRKPRAFKMRPIPRPRARKVTKAARRSRVPLYLGLLLAVAVGGGAWLSVTKPPQLMALLPRPAPSTPAPVVNAPGPLDSTPVADATPGWTWLFDEDEWRVPPDAQREYRGGLVHLRKTMEKPQPAADGTIRARMVIRDGGGLSGIFMRRTPEGGRYRLAIDPDLRFVRLIHQGSGGARELAKYRFFKSLLKGDRVVLELEARGERLFGSVNGQRVIDVQDAKIKEPGSWGIESTDGWFELVEVVAPPPVAELAEAAPAAPAKPAAPMPISPATPPMPEAPPAPLSGTSKWLITMEPQWQAGYEREVIGPHDKGMGDLKRQFLGTLEAQLATAMQARKLDDAAFFRGERQRLTAGEDIPMTDESIVPPALKNLRVGYRAELARLERDRSNRARGYHQRIDSLLAQSQAALAQRQRYEEAGEIKKKREQLTALWIKPPASPAAPAAPAAVAAQAAPAPTRLPLGAPPAPTLARTSPRQVVEKLLALGAGVWVSQKGGNAMETKAMIDLPADKFTITRVDFRRPEEGEKPVTAADLALLEALEDVTELALRGPAVTDTIVEKLRALRHLDRLTLEDAKITAASFAVLPTLPDLRELHLRRLGSGDDAIKTVGQCRKLERLTLAGLPITDAALAPIGKLPALQELDLNNLDKLTSAGLAHLAEAHGLRRLQLSGFRLSSAVIEAVARCAALEALTLSGDPLKDDQIAGLSALARLRTLNLSNTGIIGTAFAKWPTRGAMTTLNLTNEPGVDDAALKAIGSAFPKLETLEISAVPLGATAAGFASVGRLRSLRTLRVGGAVVNDEIMAEIAKCDALQSLVIPGGRLTEPGVVALTRLDRLNSLDLGVPPVTDAALKSFGRCRALKSIQISPEAPPEIETKLRGALPGVTIRK